MRMHWTVGLAVLGFCSGHVSGAPTFFSGTGHYYELVLPTEGIDWNDAKVQAEGLTYLGNPGYLATITSSTENDFIKNNIIVAPDSPWAGGYQLASSPEPDGNWKWVTAESWNYSAWSPGEPNNLGGDENALQLSWDLGWNDVNNDTLLDCYVVEYIPEPATLSLLALGGLAVLRRRRRR